MYYLNSICVAVQCESESGIQRFANYSRWIYLSILAVIITIVVFVIKKTNLHSVYSL